MMFLRMFILWISEDDWINGHSQECQHFLQDEDLKNTEPGCKFLTKGTLISINDGKTIVSQDIATLKKYEKATVQGKLNNVLGEGSFGKVCLIKNKKTSELYAMKVIEKQSTLTESALKALTAEVDIHKRLIHENIIRLHEYIDQLSPCFNSLADCDSKKSVRGNFFFLEEIIIYFTLYNKPCAPFNLNIAATRMTKLFQYNLFSSVLYSSQGKMFNN